MIIDVALAMFVIVAFDGAIWILLRLYFASQGACIPYSVILSTVFTVFLPSSLVAGWYGVVATRRFIAATQEDVSGFRSIFDQAPIGIYTLDADGVIQSFNPKMIEIAGAATEGEVIGKNALVMDSYVKVGLDKMFKEGLAGKSFDTEVTYASQSSGKQSVRHYRGVPIRSDDGERVERLLLMVSDTTEQHRLEDALREKSERMQDEITGKTAEIARLQELSTRLKADISRDGETAKGLLEALRRKDKSVADAEDRLAVLLENSSDLLFTATLDGIVTYVSPNCSLFGFRPDEIVGQNHAATFHPDDRDRTERDIAAALRPGSRGEYLGEVRLAKRPSGWRYANLMVKMRRREGVPDMIVGIIRDISEKKNIEVKVRDLQQLRHRFAGIVSSELNLPLNAVKWNIEAVLKGNFGVVGQALASFLRTTLTICDKIIQDITMVLTAVELEEGRVTYDRAPVSLANLWLSVYGQVALVCGVRGLTIKYDPPDAPLPEVMADTVKVKSVMEQLLDNAIAFTPAGGTITVRFAKVGNSVRFEVRDTGIGIPKSEQSRVFQRFFRASNSFRVKTDAPGVGLSVAKNFVEGQGGRIGFESEVGKGSTFWFDFPSA